MNAMAAKRVSYDVGCMKSLRKLPDRVMVKFMNTMTRYMSDPSATGLNFETVEGSRDNSIKSLRVDQGYRAIAFEAKRDIMFVHVNEHDKAYRWARGRRVKFDPSMNRIRIVEEIVSETVEVETAAPEQARLFSGISDKRLLALGVQREELPAVRRLASVEELDGAEDGFDSTTSDILYGLAAGCSDEEIHSQIGTPGSSDKTSRSPDGDVSFDRLIETEESRQTIFIPETEAELRRFFEGELENWRVFLHPEQRKAAYRDYNGPAMVRGGAGTGKTVVAMHRAKHLADRIAGDPARAGERILLTTFTSNLAQDIRANIETLCPEHLEGDRPRIEVIHLDGWVDRFLKSRNFDRRILYFGPVGERDRDRECLDDIWAGALHDHDLPEGLSEDFVKAEWERVVQAKGLTDMREYLEVSRAGRGTPLDRRKRAALWNVFADHRARMASEGLAEPEDAYREAAELLTSEAHRLPYAAVIVDEAQDMGEPAFRLVRAIIPETSRNDRNGIFIVGDAHQRIYARKASMSSCGINVRGRSRRLRLNYRTTHQIRSWAVSILEGVAVDDLDEGTDSLQGYVSLMRGPKPELAACKDEAEELAGLAAWIDRTVQAETQLSDVGILVNRNALVEKVREFLEARGLDVVQLQAGMADDRRVPGIRVATMHRAKGLEFFAVGLLFLSEANFPPASVLDSAVDDADLSDIVNQYRALLHVAATRAKKSLYVSWSGQRTPLFPEI